MRSAKLLATRRGRFARLAAPVVAALALAAGLGACNSKEYVTLHQQLSLNPSATDFCAHLGGMQFGSRTFLSQLELADPVLVDSYYNRNVYLGGGTYLTSAGDQVPVGGQVAGVECRFLGQGSKKVLLTFRLGTQELITVSAGAEHLGVVHPPDADLSVLLPKGGGGSLTQDFWALLNQVNYNT